MTDRIAHYLSTGEKSAGQTVKKAKAAEIGKITLETFIEPNFVCSQKHRAFFEAQIGKGFSFHVIFQKWLKTNAGNTRKQLLDRRRKSTYNESEHLHTGRALRQWMKPVKKLLMRQWYW